MSRHSPCLPFLHIASGIKSKHHTFGWLGNLKAGSHYLVQAAIELMALQFPLPQGWDLRARDLPNPTSGLWLPFLKPL